MSRADEIARKLQRAIDEGDIPPGGMLPSIPVLAGMEQVSEATARDALATLVHWGVVQGQQGRGYLVPLRKPPIDRRPQERYAHEKRRAVELDAGINREPVGALEYDAGIPTEALRLRTRYTREPLSARLAERFEVRVGEPALHRHYVISCELPPEPEVPVMVSNSWLLMADVGGHPPLLDPDQEPWLGATQHQLRQVGIEIDHIQDEIRARRPEGAEPDLLGISVGSTVFHFTKILVSTEGQVVEVAESVVPADRTVVHYRVDLERWPISQGTELDLTVATMRRQPR